MSIQDEEIQDSPLGEQFDLSCISALAPILARIPDQEPAVVAREARYLAINDLGKTVKGVDTGGEVFDGELVRLSSGLSSDRIYIDVRKGFYAFNHPITPQTQITITGKEQS